MIIFKKKKGSVILDTADNLSEIEIGLLNEQLKELNMTYKELLKLFKSKLVKKKDKSFKINDIHFVVLFDFFGKCSYEEKIYYEFNTVNMQYSHKKLNS